MAGGKPTGMLVPTATRPKILTSTHRNIPRRRRFAGSVPTLVRSVTMHAQSVPPEERAAPLRLLVNVQPDAPNRAVLQVAAAIAARLVTSVIGVAAWQPLPIDWTAGDYRAGDVEPEEREDAQRAVSMAEAEFRAIFPQSASEWRSSLSYNSPSAYLIDQGRQADLILVGMPLGDASDDILAIAGDVVIRSGRPVLLVPTNPTDVFHRIMVAYKDRPECHRATSAAMPLLLRASYVDVVEGVAANALPDAGRRLDDVVVRLRSQGVTAQAHAMLAERDTAEQLEQFARSSGAGLIVAGAWGHGRFREWMFGGVTRWFLQAPPCCILLAH